MSKLSQVSVRRPASRVVALLVLWSGLVGAAQRTAAQESPPDAPTYRRVFVPADDPESWPRDGQRRLPVAADQWQAYVRDAAERQAASAVAGARLGHVRLRGALQADGGKWSLSGSARLPLEPQGPAPQLALLEPLTLAISRPAWERQAGRPELGLWQHDDGGQAAFGVLVGQADALRFDWQCPAVAWSADGAEFLLAAPTSVTQDFRIVVPAIAELQMRPGVVRRQGAVGEDRVEWSVHCVPGATHRLRALLPIEQAAPTTRLRGGVAETYDITPRGMEYDAQIRLAGSAAADEPLRLALRGALQALRVEIDGQPATWRYGSEARQVVLVDLPVATSPLAVRVRGSAALRLERPWTLPGVRLEAERWQEGSIAVRVDPRLELTRLATSESQLRHVVGIGGAPRLEEAYRLQATSEKAEIAIQLQQRVEPLEGVLLASVDFTQRAQEAVARSTWELRCGGSGAMAFQASLAAGWALESVEVVPNEALSDWQMLERDGERVLLVHFRRSPSDAEPLELRAVGRAPLAGLPRPLRLGQLDWLRALGCNEPRRILRVRSDAGEVRAASSTGAALIAPKELDARDAERLGDVSDSLLIDLRLGDPRTVLALRNQNPAYEVRSWTTVSGLDEGFEHRYEALLEPASGVVQELRLRTAAPLPADARWECRSDDGTVEVRLAVHEAQVADAAAGVHEYRLQLPRPLSQPFRIGATFRTVDASAVEANPIEFPDAQVAVRWLVLRGHPPHFRVRSAPEALAVIPPHEEGETLPALACFRLDGSASSQAFALERVGSIARGSAGATAWHVDAHTLWLPPGRMELEARYFLEIDWAAQVDVVVPDGWELLAARFDRNLAHALAGTAAGTGGRRRSFRLPSGRRFAVFTLSLRCERTLPSQHAFVTPQAPEISLPVAGGSWTVWVPPRYEVQVAHGAGQRVLDWRQRLFGPPGATTSDAATSAGPVSVVAVGGDPWKANLPETASAPAPAGWRCVRQNFAEAPAPVFVSDVQRRVAAAWLIGLGACVATALWGAAYPRYVAAATWLAAAACLIAEGTSLELSQAAWWGSLGGWLALAGRAALPASLSLPWRKAVAAACCWATLQGAETRQSFAAPAAGDDLPAVYFPVDAARQPTGADVYVPEKLLANWLNADATPPAALATGLLGARYELDVRNASADDSQLPAPQFMTFRLRTSRAGVATHLPLRREDAQWLLEQSQLDGGPLSLRWSDDGLGCAVVVPDPGLHEVRLAFAPKISRTVRGASFAMRVPPLPGAVVSVRRDEGQPAIQVVGVAAWEGASSSERLAGYLPATDVLEARWEPSQREASDALVAEQLAWLDIEPASAVLHVRLRVSGETLPAQRVQLTVDPQLKLLPLPEDSPVQEVETFSQPDTRIHLKCAAESRLPLQIRLAFQLQRTLSTGRFSFPEVRLEGAQLSRHHFGVSLEGGLAYEVESTAELQEISAAEFAELDRDAPRSVQIAYAVNQAAPRWSLTVRPAEQPPQFRENILVECQARQALATWSAEVVAVTSAHQAVTLTLPETARQLQARVEDAEGNPLRCRLGRSGPTQGMLFLDRPLALGDNLRISGELAYAPEDRLPAPGRIFAIQDRGPIDLEVRRNLDLEVAWTDPAHAPPALIAGPANGSSDATALVGRYRVTSERLVANALRIRPNPSHVATDLAYAVTARDGNPQLIVALHAVVRHGEVDRVRFRVPAGWSESWAVAPEARILRRPHPTDAKSHLLTVLLPRSCGPGEAIDLRLTARWEPQPRQAAPFPWIDLEDYRVRRKYVALPREWQAEPTSWRYRGLRPQAIPGRLAALLDELESYDAYAATSSEFVVEWDASGSAPPTRKFLAAWGRARFDAHGDWSATVRLLVDPGESSQLRFALPAGTTLTHAAVDAQPALVVQEENGFVAQLGPAGLVRAVDIAYRAASGEPSPPLGAPVVVAADASDGSAVVNWQLIAPPRWQIASPAGKTMSAQHYAQRIAEGYARAAAESQRRLSEQPAWERQTALSTDPARAPATADRRPAWAEADAASDESIVYLATPSDSVVVVRAASTAKDLWGRLLALAALVAAPLIVRRWQPQAATVWRSVSAHPYLAGMAIGLAWRLVGDPAWLGDATVILAVLAAWATRYDQRLETPPTGLPPLTLRGS